MAGPARIGRAASSSCGCARRASGHIRTRGSPRIEGGVGLTLPGHVGASGTGGPWIRSAWRLPGAAALVVVGTLSAHAQAKQSAQPPDPAAVQRGAYLLTAANCASCHTIPGSGSAHQLAGGRALPTPFGVFFSPNITPDPIHGIRGWTFGDFKRALRRDVSPSNTHYYPVFPCTSYTGMSDSDIEDL